MNKQSELLWQWRGRIYELLTSSLSANGGNTDGNEYQKNLDNQGEAETYLQAYASLLADRREAISSERTMLAAHYARYVIFVVNKGNQLTLLLKRNQEA